LKCTTQVILRREVPNLHARARGRPHTARFLQRCALSPFLPGGRHVRRPVSHWKRNVPSESSSGESSLVRRAVHSPPDFHLATGQAKKQEALCSIKRSSRRKSEPSGFPFAHDGDITLAVRNTNYALGPVMLHLMQSGSVIPAHAHEGGPAVLLVIEGDFINEGKQHLPGRSLHVKTCQQQGPQTTEKGRQVLVLWTTKRSQGSQPGRFHHLQSRRRQ
jgi:hypothetical protein